MNHKKPGFITLLVFSILSFCSVLISLYLSHTATYKQLMTSIITKQKADRLATSCSALIESIIVKQPQKQDGAQKKDNEANTNEELMKRLFIFFNKQKMFALTQAHDNLDAQIYLSVSSEQGKINVNSLYDFETKKFIDEGKPSDKKKLCIWLFAKIATMTNTPTLFPQFEKYLALRTTDLNDVTELMSIKEFQTVFENRIFFDFTKIPNEKIFLCDIFTTCTQQDTINPWLFSYSWCNILDLHPKANLTDEEKNKLFKISQTSSPWEQNWKSNWQNLQILYNKEYKDLAQEIKTILTPLFELNIFSLLLKANIKETNATVFTIVKLETEKNGLMHFETLKTYQI